MIYTNWTIRGKQWNCGLIPPTTRGAARRLCWRSRPHPPQPASSFIIRWERRKTYFVSGTAVAARISGDPDKNNYGRDKFGVGNVECTEVWITVKDGQQIRMFNSIRYMKKSIWFILFSLVLFSASCLTACQTKLYEGVIVTALDTGTALLDVTGFRMSPNGKFIVMNVVEITDDISDMRLRTDAADLARHMGNGKIEIIDLTTQRKLMEFPLVEGNISGLSPINFAWSPDSATVYYRKDGYPSIVQIDVSTGQQTAHYFPYAQFDVHPISGFIIGWGSLVENSNLVGRYETVYTNKLVVIDPANMELQEEIIFEDVSNVFEAAWSLQPNELLVRDGLSLHRYRLVLGTPVLLGKLSHYTREMRDSYNPLANIFLLEERERGLARYLIYDPVLDCIVLQTNVEFRLNSPVWHNTNRIITLRTNEDRTMQVYQLELGLPTDDISRDCIK
jgi:hypothetical protein